MSKSLEFFESGGDFFIRPKGSRGAYVHKSVVESRRCVQEGKETMAVDADSAKGVASSVAEIINDSSLDDQKRLDKIHAFVQSILDSDEGDGEGEDNDAGEAAEQRRRRRERRGKDLQERRS